MSSQPLSIFDNSKNLRRKSKNFCGNCGGYDHTYRDCLKPITSLGVILFEKRQQIKFLLVRRKDTIGYVEFIRGKYALNDITYIKKMIDTMTIIEKKQLLERNFKLLWNNLWMENSKYTSRSFKNNYNEARTKFLKLKSGIDINNNIVSLEYLISNSKTNYKETEWGMPKGRRNNRESDREAAVREFREETGIREDEYILLESVKPFIEEYVGSDNVVYRHIYYLAKYIGKRNLTINPNNRSQVTEISKLNFFSLDEINLKIRDYYEEKKRVLTDCHQFIMDNKLYDTKNIYRFDMNYKTFKTFDKKYSKSI